MKMINFDDDDGDDGNEDEAKTGEMKKCNTRNAVLWCKSWFVNTD